jgi:hypothetical protein
MIHRTNYFIYWRLRQVLFGGEFMYSLITFLEKWTDIAFVNVLCFEVVGRILNRVLHRL